MTLKEQITEDMKSAMRAKETERLGTIRLLLAAIKQRDPLEAIDHLVPWESFRAEIEAVVLTPDELKKSSAGRKPFDAILMFRMLALQALNNLSDEQVEYQVRDRLSFTRFLGLGIENGIPDGTTLWLFREKLAKAGLIEKLFDRFDQHLAAKGYMARGGQMVDATIVPVPTQRNSRDENEAVKADIAKEDLAFANEWVNNIKAKDNGALINGQRNPTTSATLGTFLAQYDAEHVTFLRVSGD